MQGAVLQKAMWADWTRTFAMWLLAALVAASIGVLGAKPADAATFTVDRTSDAGDRNINDSVCDTSSASGRQCTLRAAIQEANDTTGADTINFNIVSTDPVKTISPASPLPPNKKAVTIDGYTQPGRAPTRRPRATTRSS